MPIKFGKIQKKKTEENFQVFANSEQGTKFQADLIEKIQSR